MVKILKSSRSITKIHFFIILFTYLLFILCGESMLEFWVSKSVPRYILRVLQLCWQASGEDFQYFMCRFKIVEAIGQAASRVDGCHDD